MKKYLILMSLALLQACSHEVSNHGFTFEEKFEHTRFIGKPKAEVIAELGTPTSTADFGKNAIYYINSKTDKTLFLKPRIIEQNALIIYFDQNQIAENVEILTFDDVNELKFVDTKTEIRGNTMTPMQQIMTNIGKYNKKN